MGPHPVPSMVNFLLLGPLRSNILTQKQKPMSTFGHRSSNAFEELGIRTLNKLRDVWDFTSNKW